jgi:hypothetical protein
LLGPMVGLYTSIAKIRLIDGLDVGVFPATEIVLGSEFPFGWPSGWLMGYWMGFIPGCSLGMRLGVREGAVEGKVVGLSRDTATKSSDVVNLG